METSRSRTPFVAAGHKLIDFILSDEDMKKLTQKQIQDILRLTSCAISDFMNSVQLGDVLKISDLNEDKP